MQLNHFEVSARGLSCSGGQNGFSIVIGRGVAVTSLVHQSERVSRLVKMQGSSIVHIDDMQGSSGKMKRVVERRGVLAL
jgi:hypothetical protein